MTITTGVDPDPAVLDPGVPIWSPKFIPFIGQD